MRPQRFFLYFTVFSIVGLTTWLVHANKQNSQKYFSPFVHGKVQLSSQQAVLTINAQGEATLPAGTTMVALIDQDCTDSMASSAPERATFSINTYEPSRPDQLSQKAYSFTLEADQTLNSLSRQMNEDACVIGVQEEQVLHASSYNEDPMHADQDYLQTIQAESGHPLMYDSSLAIQLAETEKVVIAIIDTGVALTHEDLSGVLWTNSNGENGYDFVNDDADPTDDNGHGTHCAGLAAAESSNNVGISGVMGFNQKIMGVKVLDANGAGTIAAIVNGINYAAENGADLINLSLGGPGESPMLESAIVNAVNQGVTVLVAAGNENTQISPNSFVSPAGYGRDIQGAITVGSIDAANFTRSGFSNYDNTYVELASPGSGPNAILSTYPNNGYAQLQGTSMATPIAVGAAGLVIGLLRSNGIAHTPAMIEEIMQNGALKDPNLTEIFKDGNRLDLTTLTNYLANSILTSGSGGFAEDF